MLSECCFDEAEICFSHFYTIATGKECARIYTLTLLGHVRWQNPHMMMMMMMMMMRGIASFDCDSRLLLSIDHAIFLFPFARSRRCHSYQGWRRSCARFLSAESAGKFHPRA